ncbi:NfeD family protein [Chloroflexota bacterium]
MSQLILWIIVLAVIIIVVAIFVVNRAIRAHQLQVAAGKEDLVGKTAIVDAALTPKGVVFIEGERWTATLDKGTIESGEEVVVTRVDGLKLMVTKK